MNASDRLNTGLLLRMVGLSSEASDVVWLTAFAVVNSTGDVVLNVRARTGVPAGPRRQRTRTTKVALAGAVAAEPR
ncbi:hypothetical protein GCM10007231_11610 [Nocardioides daphniae]|uniref:Uncharacterized protein n=1 Tax=Nocardioides daphniae TaxID=402297 RepID=A0ABQ1Q5S7_9ACTN|nr:hypothetical protein GCM10007231_11610 [Nocardioides daphniae]